MYDPLDELRGLGVHVRRADLRQAWAVWVPGKSAVVVATGLTRVQERCILAHQVHHLTADGPAGTDAAERERLADLAAAAKLLDERQARRLLRGPVHPAQAAESLGVTRRVLDTWLAATHTDKGTPPPWPPTPPTPYCVLATLHP